MDTAGDLRLDTAANGSPTLIAAGRYLYSRHNPERDASRALEAAARREPAAMVLFGLGLGYHADYLIEHTESTHVIVFEPVAEVLAIAEEHGSLARLRHCRRLSLATDSGSLARILPQIAGEGFETFVLPGTERLSNEYALGRRIADAFSRRLEINRNTLQRFGRLWVRNLCRNLDVIADAYGVTTLAGGFSGVPVLLLAAGPTLDQILPLLPDLSRRYLVVAVDTAVAPALRVGVRPDFAVVVDPQYWNARHLDRVISEGTMLVSEASAHPRVFESFRAETFLCSSVFPLGRAFEESLGRFGTLGAGGSVATTAWDLARLIGATDITVAGLDLGFPAGRTHCRSSYFEHLALLWGTRVTTAESVVFRYVWSAEPRPIAANDGREILSDRRMEIYRRWFTEQISLPGAPPTRMVTTGGAAIEGIALLSPEQALDRPVQRARIDRRRSDLLRALPAPDGRRRGLLQARAAELRQLLEDLQSVAEEAAATVRRIHRDCLSGQTVDFTPLVPLDRRLGRHPAGAIGSFLIQDAISRIRSGYGSAHVVEQIDASLGMYEGLAESTAYHAEELRRASERVCPPLKFMPVATDDHGG